MNDHDEYQRWLIREADKKEREQFKASFDSFKERLFEFFVYVFMLLVIMLTIYKVV